MKNLLIAVLLACCQVAAAQIRIDLPESVADKTFVTGQIRAAKSELKAYADSLFKVKGDGGGTQNPPNNLADCKRGPEPSAVFNITTTSATVLWDGEDVFGWDYSIYKGTTRVAFGSVKPTSNREPITYAGLSPGEYTFTMQANTCKSEAKSIKFTVPKPAGDNGSGGDGGNSGPPPVTGKFTYQIIMGTTGSGFDAGAKYGIEDQWIKRIEATKYSWGYGITGVCVWIPWEGYEKKRGVYEEAALLRTVAYLRERNLSLSVAFLRRRKKSDAYDIVDASGKVIGKDYFIRDNEIITGSNGTKYGEGCCGTEAIYAGYANQRVNDLSAGAIKSIARIMATYDKSFYIALTGGGAGEQVNYVFNGREYREAGDISEDNKARFDAWRAPRGIATQPGNPQFFQGPGNDWPHPNFNDPLSLEFARFTTYGIKSGFDSFADAVRSQTNKLSCIYFYSVTSNLQLRAIASAHLGYITEKADGSYGSDGDNIEEFYTAKSRVNALNLGTNPTKISMAEADIEDVTYYKVHTGKKPPYCVGGVQYDLFERVTRDLFSQGLMVMNLAMAYCEDELRGFEPAFRSLRQDYVGRDYVWPSVNSSNTVTVDITDKYRNSIDLLEGVNYTKPFKYIKYVAPTFFGGVSPEVGDVGGPVPPASKDYSPVKSYVEANLANAYNWNVVFDLRSPSGELYSFEKGGKTKDTRFKVMSHSKFTTGVIIAYLIDQGKLSLDTKVADIIKSLKGTAIGEVTIRQIMGHLSGIPDNQSNEGAKTLEEHVNWIAGLGLEFTPGSQFKYSTVSYQVVARMAEIVTGKKWKDLFKEILVDPCEMGQAEYNPVGTGDVKGNPNNPLAGYGLICSENEWMNFIGMIRDKGMFKGRRVLNQNVFNILKTQTSPGWSDWGVGVMIKDGKYVSEAASGCGTTIMEGEYAWAIFTDSSYDKTYWQNIEVRKIVDQIHQR